MGKITPKAPFLLLSFLLISHFFSTISAQLCKSHAFPNNEKFATCNDLPVLNSYLYWNYDPNTQTAKIAFRATGLTSSNWIAWALNPKSSGMIGAQALVAYRNATGITAYTSAVTSTSTTLAPSTLSFPVTGVSALRTGKGEMVIVATVKPPSTKVNQVWQVGSLGSGGAPAGHPLSGDSLKSSGNIDFLSGQTTSSGSEASSKLRKKNVSIILNY